MIGKSSNAMLNGQAMADTFTQEYETAAAAATSSSSTTAAAGGGGGRERVEADGTATVGQELPFLSPTGLWLQSYGFSKACLGGYCQLLARSQPSVLSVACSPGFVQTDMASTYSGDTELKSIDEGGATPAWLASGTDHLINLSHIR